jgi:hypothetical protein
VFLEHFLRFAVILEPSRLFNRSGNADIGMSKREDGDGSPGL